MESISFLEGFLSLKRDDGVFHTYDDELARKLTLEKLERNPDLVRVDVGLDGDWNENSDTLWTKEEGFKTPNFHKRSRWAKPRLMFYFNNGYIEDGSYCYFDAPIED